MKEVIRGEKNGKLLRFLILDYTGNKESLRKWKAYFATLHVEVVEPVRLAQKGGGKGPQLRDGDPGFGVIRSTLYKTLITTRTGETTYAGFEVREQSPMQVEITSGVPQDLHVNWLRHYASLTKIADYRKAMKDKLKGSVVPPGPQIVHEKADGEEGEVGKPALPPTYPVKFRWSTQAVAPGSQAAPAATTATTPPTTNPVASPLAEEHAVGASATLGYKPLDAFGVPVGAKRPRSGPYDGKTSGIG